ncbi:hypothetical protein PCANB_000109 [Pneumocystis canis]|nr:hypothetical protein PCANB_000109 [Pneumocystis canis]
MAEEMPFIGVYRSLYPYQPQQNPELVVAENRELELEENELLYILEKGEDLWWRAKKKAISDQEDGEVGLVPGNYLEECQPIYQVRTLYDYEQQSFEEISFNEGEILDVFDEDGENWVFARCGTAYGFAPSNYLEKITDNTVLHNDNSTYSKVAISSPSPSISNLHLSPKSSKKTNVSKETSTFIPSQQVLPTTQSFKNIGVGEKEKMHKNLENSEILDAYAVSNEPYFFNTHQNNSNENVKTWVVHEVYKKKRRKGILGVGNNSITFSSESNKNSSQVWPITSIIRHSFEKKHLFIDIYSDKSSISFDFHAGSSEVAAEIYSVIENLVNTARSSNLQEITSSLHQNPENTLKEVGKTSCKDRKFTNDNDNNDKNINNCNHKQLEGEKGIVLYDFNASEEDELSVKANTHVHILDNTTNNDWWKVRKGDTEGLVPASYIRYLPRDLKDLKKIGHHNDSQKPEKTVRLEKKLDKPQLDKVKTWTDRTGTFKVDAQFLGIIDNKIHLHKLNGVKISVPLSKMSEEDIRYIENITESSKNKQNVDTNALYNDSKYSKNKDKAIINKHENYSTSVPKNNYDWFNFFLSSGVKYNLCQSYTTNFENDNLNESNLLDLTPENMRTLGIREDDIIRITRYIREKYKNKLDAQESKSETNKVKTQTNSSLAPVPDTLKKNEFNLSSTLSNEKSKDNNNSLEPQSFQDIRTTHTTHSNFPPQNKNNEFSPKIKEAPTSGFDDDAWSIKSSNTEKNYSLTLQKSDASNPQLVYSMRNLSLLTPPMKPTHPAPISTQISQQQIQQNIMPLTHPVSQTVLQNQFNVIDQFSTAFSTSIPNSSYFQPFQSYGISNTPVIASQQGFSSSVIQPSISHFQQQTFQPQTEFGQKIKQQISENPSYLNPQFSTNQIHIMHNPFPLIQNVTPLPMHIQNNRCNNPIQQQQDITQQSFQMINFHHSLPSQYNTYNQQSTFFQGDTQLSLNKHQTFENNFFMPQALENVEKKSFSTVSQPANTLTPFQQAPVFKPVQFGISKSHSSNCTRKRANLEAATPENPFGF